MGPRHLLPGSPGAKAQSVLQDRCPLVRGRVRRGGGGGGGQLAAGVPSTSGTPPQTRGKAGVARPLGRSSRSGRIFLPWSVCLCRERGGVAEEAKLEGLPQACGPLWAPCLGGGVSPGNGTSRGGWRGEGPVCVFVGKNPALSSVSWESRI